MCLNKFCFAFVILISWTCTFLAVTFRHVRGAVQKECLLFSVSETVMTGIVKYIYHGCISYQVEIVFYRVSFTVNTLYWPLHVMLYASHVNLFAKESELFTHTVFQLVVCDMALCESILQETVKVEVLGGDCCSVGTVWRRRTWFIFLFGWTFQICCFNFLTVCTYHSELIGALLLKNYNNKNPSLSRKMLAMTLPTEVCTLNLFFLIVPAVPIYYPATSIFLAWRMHCKDVSLWITASWNTWCMEGLMLQWRILPGQHSIWCRGIKIVLIMMGTLWKYDLSVVKVVCMTHVNSIIIVVTVSEGRNRRYYYLINFCNIGYDTFLNFELFSVANMNTPVTPVCCHIFSTNEWRVLEILWHISTFEMDSSVIFPRYLQLPTQSVLFSYLNVTKLFVPWS